MAITWGSYDQGNDGNGLRAGIELTITDTDNITAKYYVGNEYNKSDTETSTRTGYITGSTSFSNNGGSGSTILVDTVVKDGEPGTTYTLGHKISGAYNGATPSVSDSIKIPPKVPGAPTWEAGTPTSITTTSVYLDWDAPSSDGGGSIDRYHLQVDNSSGFGSPLEDNTDAGGGETVDGMSPGGTYYARVRAHNSSGYGAWSSTKSFKTKAAVPSAPVWVSGTPTDITQTTAFFDWGAPTNDGGGTIDAYHIEVNKASDFSGSDTYDNPNAGGSETVTGLTYNTTYYARVRAHNEAGWGPWNSTKTFKTDPGVPSTVGTPTASAITATTATLTWTAPSNNGSTIDGYDVEVDDSSGFASPIWNHFSSDAVDAVTGLKRATTYYARVKAHNAVGYSVNWSGYRTFTTLPTIPSAPGKPTISSVTSTTAVASWTAPSDNGGATITAYDVEYATNSAFTTGKVTQADGNLKNLTAGVTYWVHVRAKNSAGTGSWSAATSFTTTAAGLRVWDGTAWTPVPLEAWGGSAWVDTELMIWNGSAWVAAV